MSTHNALSLIRSLMDARSMRGIGNRARGRALAAINEAIDWLAADFPESFITLRTSFPLLKYVYSEDQSVRVSVDSSDPRTMYFTTTAGADLTLSSAWLPNTARQWDGVYRIHIEDANGTWRDYGCLHFFVYTNQGTGAARWAVTLDAQWPNATDTLLKFKLYQDYFALPSRLSRIEPPVRFKVGTTYVKVHEAPRGATHYAKTPFDQNVSPGNPAYYGKSTIFTMPTPSAAPIVTASGSWAGAGNLPQGRYYVCFTYVRGLRATKTPQGLQEPVWESGPSPIAVFDHADNAGSGMLITPQNLDPTIGFWDPAATRPSHGRSGLYARIYVARASESGGVTAPSPVQVDLTFYALADIQLTQTPNLTWLGSALLDRTFELQPSYAYQLYDISNPVENNGDLLVQGPAHPERLRHGADVLQIDARAMPAFRALAMYYFCQKDGMDLADAKAYLDTYESLRDQVRINVNSHPDEVPLAGLSDSRERLGPLDEVATPFTFEYN